MAQPAELDELQDPLVQAYRRAWSRVVAEQQALAANPLAYRRRSRLVEVRRSIETMMDDLDEGAASWVSQQLPKAYAAGMASSGSGFAETAWTQINQEAIQRLATGLFHELLGATEGVRATTKELIREVARDEALQKAIEGRTAKQAGIEMRRVLESKGISSVTYANGAKHGLAEYSEMAMRTTTAKAYNSGSLAGAPDVKFFEIFDGPQCGLSFHDDPTLALGLIVDRETAERYLIAHPNCRRSFGGRPDITSKKQAKATKGQVTDAQTAAQRQQDAERLARQRRVAERQAKLDTGPAPIFPPAEAETGREAARRAKIEYTKFRQGNITMGPEPSPPMQALMPPIEAAAKTVADVPTVTQLIDKGYSAEDAIKEHERLLKNARNVERRARKKALGQAQDDLSKTGTAPKFEGKTPAQLLIEEDRRLPEGSQPAVLHSQPFGPGGAGITREPLTSAEVAEAKIRALDRWEKAKANAAKFGEDHSDEYWKQWFETSLKSELAAASNVKPISQAKAWYDRLTVDTPSYTPVANLSVQNYIIRNGIATRRNGISYMLEVPEGPITQAMRDQLEAHIAKIQTTLADVPAEARIHQRGYAMLKGQNPADAYWAKEYKIPGFRSAATGGNGGTTFWDYEVNPGTIVHELGHNLDSGHAASRPGAWLSDGAVKLETHGDSLKWEDFRGYDSEINGSSAFNGFTETRMSGHPITRGTDGATSYGSASIHEDFAESFRLYVKDRREGKLGYGPIDPNTGLGVNIRFVDLFPERAAYFDKILGLKSETDTSWRRRQLAKLEKDWGHDPAVSNIEHHVATLEGFAKSPTILAKQYGLPEAVVKEHLGTLVTKARAAEEARLAAIAAAEAKAAALKPLTAKDLSFGDKTGIGVKAGNAKKLALKQGKSEREAQEIFDRTKRELTQAKLDELNRAKGIGSGTLDVDHSLQMLPDFVESERIKAYNHTQSAGLDVHPLAKKQVNKSSQTKANLVAEIASRLNNEADWEKFRTYQNTLPYSDYSGKIKAFSEYTSAQRQAMLDEETSRRVANWASTSGDDNITAVAMQRAIKEEFGTTGDPFGGSRGMRTRSEVDAHYRIAGDFYRRFARNMYEHTQEELRRQGITHVSVYRGMNLDASIPWGKIGTKQRPKLMPANSWSANRDTSVNFGRTMFKARIPIERILGTARTGFGCRNEYEFVIFDSEGLAIVERS